MVPEPTAAVNVDQHNLHSLSAPWPCAAHLRFRRTPLAAPLAVNPCALPQPSALRLGGLHNTFDRHDPHPCPLHKTITHDPCSLLPPQLGQLQVSPMGLGTWAWGNRFLWGYDESMDPELQVGGGGDKVRRWGEDAGEATG